jgi:lipoprotein-releasing system permease protein
MKPALTFIAARYLTGRRRHRFGGLIGLFSFFALLIGVAALILVLSIMNGFNTELSGRFLQVLPHATIFSDIELQEELEADLRGNTSVTGLSKTIEDFILLTHEDRQLAIGLTAIDPVEDAEVVDMQPNIVSGSWDDFTIQQYGVALGRQAANSLGVVVGDQVRVNFPRVRVLPTGVYPLSRGFVVTAIFATNSQIDSELALVRLVDAEPLMRNSSAEYGYRIKTENPLVVDRLLSSFSDNPNLQYVPWQARLHGLYEAMKMEKLVVGAMLVLVVLVASFSLVASLVMAVAEKRTDIAVLKTMGADSHTVVGIFVLQALAFGLVGISAGAILGSLLAFNFSGIVGAFETLFGFQVFDPNVFYVSQLPTDWRLSDLIAVCLISGLIALLAAILPAIQASRITPAEAIHYNS